jgi:hypothetical protein
MQDTHSHIPGAAWECGCLSGVRNCPLLAQFVLPLEKPASAFLDKIPVVDFLAEFAKAVFQLGD